MDERDKFVLKLNHSWGKGLIMSHLRGMLREYESEKAVKQKEIITQRTTPSMRFFFRLEEKYE